MPNYYTSCPQCQAQWSAAEYDKQYCNSCGYIVYHFEEAEPATAMDDETTGNTDLLA